MPKKPIDYGKTTFYKIVCNDLNIKDCYVGHTTDFRRRKHQHKRTCYDETDQIHYNIYLYEFIRNNGGWDNFDMVEISTECITSSLEARRKEREYIEQLNATLNKIRPVRTEEEHVEYHRQYYAEKKEQLLTKFQTTKVSCECGTVVRKADFRRHERSNKHQEYIKSLVID